VVFFIFFQKKENEESETTTRAVFDNPMYDSAAGGLSDVYTDATYDDIEIGDSTEGGYMDIGAEGGGGAAAFPGSGAPGPGGFGGPGDLMMG